MPSHRINGFLRALKLPCINPSEVIPNLLTDLISTHKKGVYLH